MVKDIMVKGQQKRLKEQSAQGSIPNLLSARKLLVEVLALLLLVDAADKIF